MTSAEVGDLVGLLGVAGQTLQGIVDDALAEPAPTTSSRLVTEDETVAP